MQNENFFFSVICPTYNSENYIKKNFYSLLSQSYQNFEVIYIDDGSTDNTVNVLKKLIQNHNNFKLFEKNHGGPGSARNFGINKSNGEWVSFIDSDDTWHPLKLLKINTSILENTSRNFIVHWEKFIKLNGEIKILKHGSDIKNKKLFLKRLYSGNFLSTSAVVLKKKLLLDYGIFDEQLPNAQDYDLWLKLAPHMSLFTLEEVLGEYNETKDSITLRPYYKRIISELKIAFRYKNYHILYLIKIFKILFSKRWLR
jgi:glycosyltransferase involved in cell wall biosynthesis